MTPVPAKFDLPQKNISAEQLPPLRSLRMVPQYSPTNRVPEQEHSDATKLGSWVVNMTKKMQKSNAILMKLQQIFKVCFQKYF